MPFVREFPPLQCIFYNECISEQCPLNPDHSVEDIQPENRCRLSSRRRQSIAESFEPGVCLPYNGLTRDEYNVIVRKLESKVKVKTTAEDLKVQREADRKARIEAIVARNKLYATFRDITQDMTTQELQDLISDISEGLGLTDYETFIQPQSTDMI